MPLLLVTMPLAVLSTTPGVELTLGNSLIPVTGIVLLLRNLLEGTYWPAAAISAASVLAVTLAGCLLAIRWAVDQFNSEIGAVPRERAAGLGPLAAAPAPRPAGRRPPWPAAVFCGVLILLVRFFMGSALPIREQFRRFRAADAGHAVAR